MNKEQLEKSIRFTTVDREHHLGLKAEFGIGMSMMISHECLQFSKSPDIIHAAKKELTHGILHMLYADRIKELYEPVITLCRTSPFDDDFYTARNKVMDAARMQPHTEIHELMMEVDHMKEVEQLKARIAELEKDNEILRSTKFIGHYGFGN